MRLKRFFGKYEVVGKILSIGTITLGGWIIFDKARDMLVDSGFYDQWWWLIGLGLLYLGLEVFDFE